MREILFRGKRLVYGDWIEGSLWVHLGVPKILTAANTVGYDVYPDTVGQYTGLQDKNGKRIFEWDIIHTSRDGGRTYVVIYDDDLCAFVGRVYESNIFVTFEGYGDWYEIIGNIHDNPELLEADHED